MTDREISKEIIDGLRCATGDPMPCAKCRYREYMYGICKSKCAEDAITLLKTLLKAQEPRVMTLEETGKADISWLEVKDMNRVMPCRIRYSDGWFIKLFEGSPERFAESEYGTELRCWTARPDEKVRAETPWQS